jgi:hypothetical protein
MKAAAGYVAKPGVDDVALMDIIETAAPWDLVDFRAGKAGIQDYLEAHKDKPPGVEVNRALAVAVRTK